MFLNNNSKKINIISYREKILVDNFIMLSMTQFIIQLRYNTNHIMLNNIGVPIC